MEIKVETTLRCGFCGQTVTVGRSADGKRGVFHEMPLCKQFEKMEPLDFLIESKLKTMN